MKQTVTRGILLLSLLCILAGVAAAEATFSTGDRITISTSASVQGTINETVSLTKSTGGMEKTELRSSYTGINPIGISWRSHLSVNSDEESAWVSYSRSGDLPRLSWRQYFGK